MKVKGQHTHTWGKVIKLNYLNSTARLGLDRIVLWYVTTLFQQLTAISSGGGGNINHKYVCMMMTMDM